MLLRHIIYHPRKQRGKLCCLRTEHHPSSRRNPYTRKGMRGCCRSEHILLFTTQHIAPMGNTDQQLSRDGQILHAALFHNNWLHVDEGRRGEGKLGHQYLILRRV